MIEPNRVYAPSAPPTPVHDLDSKVIETASACGSLQLLYSRMKSVQMAWYVYVEGGRAMI